MTRDVHLAVYDTFADWEPAYATAHINSSDWQRNPGRFRVVTVGRTAQAITSKGGLRVTPEITLAELDPSDSAMLILPGADTWLTGGNTEFVDAARSFIASDVPVAAICGATVGLAAGGLLDDREHTSNHPVVLESTGYAGAGHYRESPAVNDSGLITASATAPVAFAREIMAALSLYEPSVLDSWYKLYGEGDPIGYFELMEATA